MGNLKLRAKEIPRYGQAKGQGISKGNSKGEGREGPRHGTLYIHVKD